VRLKVLLLTASFGDGHNQAAVAVAEALRDRGIEVMVVDYMEWLHPALRSFAKFTLIQGVQKVPELYGVFYRSMSRLQSTSQLQRQLNHLGVTQMRRYLRWYQPNVVASTFPTPNGVLSELVKQGVTRVPAVGIVTDYTVHGQWIHDATALYCVANETAATELHNHGIDRQHIAVTGIPVRRTFSTDCVAELLKQRRDQRQQEHLEANGPLVLIMGGGAGILGDVSDWTELVQTVDMQFVIICGRNERLLRKFQPVASPRVRVLGYTADVHRWMAMADLIVTKPGGITLTEAMAMQLPMILFRPIPGQEESNADFALRMGVARLAKDVKTVRSLLREFLESPQKLEKMRAAARSVQLGDSAAKIADLLLELGSKGESSVLGRDA